MGFSIGGGGPNMIGVGMFDENGDYGFERLLVAVVCAAIALTFVLLVVAVLNGFLGGVAGRL